MPTRRRFLTSAASGLGFAALASLLRDDGLLADDRIAADPLAQAKAVESRHLTIGHQHFRLPLQNNLPGFFAVPCAAHVVAGAAEFELCRADDVDFVVAK